MKHIDLEILLPERVFYTGKVNFITLPTTEGEITLLPHHMDCLLKLVPGLLYFHADYAKNSYFITYGYVRLKNNICHITVDHIIEPTLFKEKLAQIKKENILSQEELFHIENNINFIYRNMY